MNAAGHDITDSYDVEAIRRDFPILSREVYGKPLVYLDNGASAQKPQAVLDAIHHAYTQEYANVHRGLHFLSNAATDAYEKARETVRRFLNAAEHRGDRLHLEHDGGDQHGRLWLGHAAISARATRSCCRSWSTTPTSCRGISSASGRARSWSGRRSTISACSIIEEFEKRLTERTKLVAITHMSNALGTVTPIKEIVPHRPCSAAFRCWSTAARAPSTCRSTCRISAATSIVFTGHKVYGPSGIGVLYGKQARCWSAMRPFQGGGEMIFEVTEDNVTYNDPPHRFEAGTPPIVQAIGLGAALDYMESVGREAIAAHEADLQDLCA